MKDLLAHTNAEKKSTTSDASKAANDQITAINQKAADDQQKIIRDTLAQMQAQKAAQDQNQAAQAAKPQPQTLAQQTRDTVGNRVGGGGGGSPIAIDFRSVPGAPGRTVVSSSPAPKTTATPTGARAFAGPPPMPSFPGLKGAGSRAAVGGRSPASEPTAVSALISSADDSSSSGTVHWGGPLVVSRELTKALEANRAIVGGSTYRNRNYVPNQ